MLCGRQDAEGEGRSARQEFAVDDGAAGLFHDACVR
jgi:hypothetical protein